MELKEEAQEILETLWVQTEEQKKKSVAFAELEELDGDGVQQLLQAGYIASEDDHIVLTPEGRKEAEMVIRKHRLAERLVADVFHSEEQAMEEHACKFEHLLGAGLEANICTLLGHPKVCPHGKPIPPGKCCLAGLEQPQRVISRLSEMKAGQGGRIAYIHTPQSGQSTQLQKLIAMGILPGAPIILLQTFPSYVFQVRQTQFAIDKETADCIYVRLGEAEPLVAGEERQGESGRHGASHRRRGLWRWGGR